jgi:hypothetical protein
VQRPHGRHETFPVKGVKAVMLKKTSVLAVMVACCLLSGLALAKGNDIAIRAGLGKKDDQGNVQIYKETTTIPFVSITSDPTFYFGAIATTASGKEFLCRTVIYIPKQDSVRAAHGSEPRLAEMKANDTHHIVELKEILTRHCEAFIRLDNEDISGNYGMEFYIDGHLVRKIQFEVQEKIVGKP